MPGQHPQPKLLVANRSEIAIRVFRSAHELEIRTIAIYSHEDRFALHRFKADEAYRVGKPGEPIRAYLDIDGIVALARQVEVDAIHPGYGFLSENAAFARACRDAGLTFVGPRVDILEQLGDKVVARHGNLVHLFERDCSVQRRHQKIVEIAPAVNLDATTRQRILDAALRVGRAVRLDNAGTVEFLVNADTGEFYFIEVNPRIQVE